MEVLHTAEKGRYTRTLEKIHIYAETRNNNQINDKNTVKNNAIFEVVCSHNPTRVKIQHIPIMTCDTIQAGHTCTQYV
jgi:uncharacterized protein YfaQ (DUF2300 family)